MNGRVLIIDDEAGIRSSLGGLLKDEDLQVYEAESGEEGLRLVEEHDPDLVLLDLLLSGIDGLEVLSRMGERGYYFPVIMMSGQANLDDAIQATRLGAMTFLEKPLTPERVLAEVSAGLELAKLKRENRDLRQEIQEQHHMVGESAPMQRLKERIRKVAPTQATVLILGESGTGKELVARAVHEHSDRSDRAFVKVNCAAIPGELIESELFGHEKGSFTGASSLHRGRFEQADGGSIFLDEVADTSPAAQARLLRVLQEGEVQRIGSEKVLHVDVRVIAASNQNLEELIRDGRFREDLYYRLKVVTITLPPLRQRQDDIPLLIDFFLERYAAELGMDNPGIASDAVKTLNSHQWPGNVRELANTLQKALIFSRGAPIRAEDVIQALSAEKVPGELDAIAAEDTIRRWMRGAMTSKAEPDTFEKIMDHLAAMLVGEALNLTDGNRTRAAELLGLSRPTLHSKIEKYGLKLKTSVEEKNQD